MSDKICKFFVKNNCVHGDKCTFIHEKNICRNYFFDGNCNRGDSCKFNHNYKLNDKKDKNKIKPKNSVDKELFNGKRRSKVNTTDFTPNHEPLDMNIIVNKSLTQYKENDVIIVPNFVEENYNGELYNKLLNEMNSLGIDDNKLWLEWHGENHLIADDTLKWKNNVPTFNYIIDEIKKYFNMEVKSTRLNLYEDSNDWKPYHHDAAAIKEHIAEVQNFTVGLSLGATRDIAFQHAKTKTSISIPLDNCTAYAFSKKINIDWKHGIPQIDPNKAFTDGRISIIVWGKVNLE
jgi:hypothetical protein